MKPDLQCMILDSYPQLFANGESESAYPRLQEFSCGNGWFCLIDAFCAEVARLVADGVEPPVTILQVKQKLGSLRINFRGGGAAARAMRELVVRLSICIDEETGASSGARTPG